MNDTHPSFGGGVPDDMDASSAHLEPGGRVEGAEGKPADGATPEPAPTAEFQQRLEEALREKEQFRAMAQRAQADLINYRRRAEEEQEEARRRATAQMILKVLGVADGLERALAEVPDDVVTPGWLKGLRLVQRKMESLLESEGVTRIEALGRPFAPSEHEAVLYEISPDGAEEGMVVRVIREGYKLKGKAISDSTVLRPAQVAVSKAPEREVQSESADEES